MVDLLLSEEAVAVKPVVVLPVPADWPVVRVSYVVDLLFPEEAVAVVPLLVPADLPVVLSERLMTLAVELLAATAVNAVPVLLTPVF